MSKSRGDSTLTPRSSHPIPRAVSAAGESSPTTTLSTIAMAQSDINGDKAAVPLSAEKSPLSALFTGSTLLYTVVLAVSLALYLFVLPSPAPLPRGYPLSQCVPSAFTSTSANIDGRAKHFQTPTTIAALRESYRDKWVHLVGDSTLRDTYYELAALLSRKGTMAHVDNAELAKRNATRHKAQMSRIGSSKLTFSWAPYIKNVSADWITTMKGQFKPDLVIVSVGLHDLLYQSPAAIDGDIDNLVSVLSVTHASVLSTAVPSLLYKTSPYIIDSNLGGHRKDADHFRAENLQQFNENLTTKLLVQLKNTNKFSVADGYELTKSRPHQFHDDGLHSQYASSITALSLAATSSCHFGTPPFDLSAGQLTLLVLTLVVMFTIIYTAICAMLARNYGKNGKHAYLPVTTSDIETNTVASTDASTNNDRPVTNGHGNTGTVDKQPQWSLPSLAQLFHLDYYFSKEASQVLISLLQLSLILIFLFIIDSDHRLSWQLIGDKLYVRDTLAFIVLGLLLVSVSTWKYTEVKSAVLNRDQTEEWKGWMQLLFVLYHYFAAKELYNLIRVFIAAYVWLTGYGNFLFFNRFGDYSFVRLAKLMFRLNFFVWVVCWAMDREYMQYYVCALHTTFFLFVYLFMWVGHQRNNNQYFMAVKFAAGFVVLFLVWDVPKWKFFDVLFAKFSLFYWKNSLHEWRFRSTLDHYATYIGMLVAWQIHRLDAFYQWLEKLESKRVKYTVTVSTVAVVLAVTGLWVQHLLLQPKGQYNAHNPYTSWIPILAYIVLRNWTSYLRSHHLAFFAYFGKITLETYILQFHVWLSDDAATLIFYTGNFNYPLVNFLLASAIYIYLAQCVFSITGVLSDALIPAKASANTAVSRLVTVGAVITAVYVASQTSLLLTR